MKTILFIGLLLNTSSQGAGVHDGSKEPEKSIRPETNERTVNRKPAVLEHFVECDSEGAVKDTVPRELPKNQFVRAMIVQELNGMWSLASEKDVQLKGSAECTTILSGANKELIGKYNLSHKGPLNCAAVPPMLPGALIPGKEGSHSLLRYVGMLPKKKTDSFGKVAETWESGPVQWIPTPCGLQNEDPLVSIEDTEGETRMKGFTLNLKLNTWEPLEEEKAQAGFERMLAKIATESGEGAEKSRRCLNSLRGDVKRNEAVGAVDGQTPQTATVAPERSKRDSLSMPFNSPGENSSSILRAQEGYFDE